ncbi:MAG: type III pantothenate kinase, partial [Blastocatellia bacterium]|nr:type III pantothenate kinase [Blastocatellia bacterium]
MFLAVDIGNSRIKLGVFDGENLIQMISLPTPRVRKFSPVDLHEIAEPISRCLICSVVPEINVSVAAAIEELYAMKPTIVCNDFDFGMTILHTPLETIG